MLLNKNHVMLDVKMVVNVFFRRFVFVLSKLLNKNDMLDLEYLLEDFREDIVKSLLMNSVEHFHQRQQ